MLTQKLNCLPCGSVDFLSHSCDPGVGMTQSEVSKSMPVCNCSGCGGWPTHGAVCGTAYPILAELEVCPEHDCLPKATAHEGKLRQLLDDKMVLC